MRRVPSIVTLLGLMALATTVGAFPRAGNPAGGSEEGALPATTQRGPVSLAQAREMALQRFPGRVVRAETVTVGSDRTVHQIRILDAEGRVRNVRIDAQTGAFL